MFSMSTSSSSPFVLNQDRSTVHIVRMQQLDFETTNSYFFTIVASDGVNQDVANITINVEDVNERPLIELDSPAPSIIIGPGSESQLILVDIEISDPDFGDSVSESLLQLRNIPEGSVETLGWSEVTALLKLMTMSSCSPGKTALFPWLKHCRASTTSRDSL